jgi:enoyl-CoA hydratase/carnithine racemase
VGSTVEARIVDGVILIELAGQKDAGPAAAEYPRLERAVLAAIGREIEAAARARLPVVLAGAERAFAVGADVGEVAALDPLAAVEFARAGQRVMGAIAGLEQPAVAAIRGYCFGGALDLALACARRIATPDAQFAHRGAALGIITGWSGTARLPRLVGRAPARELFATGRALDAREGLRWGLIERIVSPAELLPAACELARRHAQGRLRRA